MKNFIEVQTAQGSVLINVNTISSIGLDKSGLTKIVLLSTNKKGYSQTISTSQGLDIIKQSITDSRK